MAGISTVAESIVRILQTPLGSRVYRPNYGSLLYTLRDRKFNDEWRLKATKYTYEAILNNEPRVQLQKVDFSIDLLGRVNLKVSFEYNEKINDVEFTL